MTARRSRARRGRAWRLHLASRLSYSPLLRLLIVKPLFRTAVVLLVLAVLAVGMALPKIWVTSPTGFEPVVKVSIVDRIQAWSLARGARRLARAGEHAEANRAWRVAWANNLADADQLRESLEHTLRSPSPDRDDDAAASGMAAPAHEDEPH